MLNIVLYLPCRPCEYIICAKCDDLDTKLVKFMNTDKHKPGLIWNCATCRETKLFKLTKLSNGHKEVKTNKYKKYNYQNK